jgi:hypothetical protein
MSAKKIVPSKKGDVGGHVQSSILLINKIATKAELQ